MTDKKKALRKVAKRLGLDEPPQKPRKTQKTAQGYEIPVPTREQFLRDLKKATRRPAR